MASKTNLIALVLFSIFLLISSYGVRNSFRRKFILRQDKCFQFDLKKRSAPIQTSLNLINLFSYHKALIQKESSFVSLYQKKETNSIKKSKIVIDDKNNDSKPNASISVYMTNRYNAEFLGEIAIGKGKQPFSIIFDTGSNDVLINSQICITANCASGHQYKGETHFPLMKQFAFGSGEIVGMLSKANFYLGKNEVQNVFFYEILAEDEMISQLEGFEGIVGMGLGDDGPIPGFLDYVVKQKEVPSLFSVFLNREEGNTKSKIIFGGIDDKLFKGKPKYYNVNDDFYWAVDMEGIIVGDKDTGLCSKQKKCKAVIDTGTSFFASSTANIVKIASMIEVEGSCKNFKSLPDIKFIFDGDAYIIGPKEYILTLTANGLDPIYQHSKDKDIIECVGAFSPMDFSGMENYYILGDLFLTKYYSVFDKKNKRIGLAESI